MPPSILDIHDKLKELKRYLPDEEYQIVEKTVYLNAAAFLDKTRVELVEMITLPEYYGDDLLAAIEMKIQKAREIEINQTSQFLFGLIGSFMYFCGIVPLVTAQILLHGGKFGPFSGETGELPLFGLMLIGLAFSSYAYLLQRKERRTLALS